ncbi:hypothetical protein ACFQH2_09880 [Natronoarchaeum sp. GCM10025703]|uniref:hypothetical protein n=1 Tax=unclassified Natronoarchaeum TaxID=2620183 RepID=UPI00361CD932
MEFILTSDSVLSWSMGNSPELTPAQIIKDKREESVLTAREIIGEAIDDEGVRSDESEDETHPRADWMWLDKEKLRRKELIADRDAAQSTS